MSDQAYNAIIVGAGLGGATCAGLLAKQGLHVLLLDKNGRPGGKAMSISKNGYTYTAWVIIGAPVIDNLYQAVLDELGVADQVELVAAETQGAIYRTAAGEYKKLPSMPVGETDPAVVFDWLGIDPEDQIRAFEFFAKMTMMPLEEIAKLHGTSLDAWLSGHDVPRPLYAMLVSLCCDGMFMVPVDTLDAGEAVKSLQDMFLRHGGVFCRGGFGKLAEAYCEGVRRHGSEVRMGTRVDRIDVEEGRVVGVTTSAGSFRAPIVISNAGIQPTVTKLVGEEHFPQDYVKGTQELVPSWALVGYRYFLSRPVTDEPYGVVFSDDTPWNQERLELARSGRGPRKGVVYYEVPSNYDPDAAPPGKQVMLSGCFCPPDPEMTKEQVAAWVDDAEQVLFEAFPDLEGAIEDKDLYTPRHVSNLSRDSVGPGLGGETVGVGQIVGQCGPGKPAVQSPLEGLLFVGADAGGTGIGTQQAVESGMNVAKVVAELHGRSTP